MNWLKTLVVEKLLGGVVDWLNGKKTAIGALTLLVWTWAYVVPVLYPGAAGIIPFVQTIVDALSHAGVLDQELLAAGTGLTVVGLVHKAVKYFKKEG